MRTTLRTLLCLCGFAGCGVEDKPVLDQQVGPGPAPARADVSLKKPIGITTFGDVFTPLVKAGQALPFTMSETFTNRTDGGPELMVLISQKDETGVETIASLILPIPPVPDNTLQVTVTLKLSIDKNLKIKTTVSSPPVVKEFGPFPVE